MSRQKLTRAELTAALNLAIRRQQNTTDAFDEAVAAALGINRTDLRCLDILEQEGSITAGRLAERMGLSTGATTAVLDRLERAGFARRVRDASDRRRVLVELTPEVQKRSWEYYAPLAERAEELYGRYTEEELGLLLDFMQTAAELFEPLLAEIRDRLPKS